MEKPKFLTGILGSFFVSLVVASIAIFTIYLGSVNKASDEAFFMALAVFIMTFIARFRVIKYKKWQKQWNAVANGSTQRESPQPVFKPAKPEKAACEELSPVAQMDAKHVVSACISVPRSSPTPHNIKAALPRYCQELLSR